MSSPFRICSGVFTDSFNEKIASCNIIDGGEVWVVEFGVDGENIGLCSVNIEKLDVEGLNIWGLLELALGRTNPRFRNSYHNGKALNDLEEASSQRPASLDRLGLRGEVDRP